MDQVTRSNSTEAAKLTSTAQSLASQAKQLQELVSRFRLTVDSAEDEEFPGATDHEERPVPFRGQMVPVERF
jgi:hypothetical protein